MTVRQRGERVRQRGDWNDRRERERKKGKENERM